MGVDYGILCSTFSGSQIPFGGSRLARAQGQGMQFGREMRCGLIGRKCYHNRASGEGGGGGGVTERDIEIERVRDENKKFKKKRKM